MRSGATFCPTGGFVDDPASPDAAQKVVLADHRPDVSITAISTSTTRPPSLTGWLSAKIPKRPTPPLQAALVRRTTGDVSQSIFSKKITGFRRRPRSQGRLVLCMRPIWPQAVAEGRMFKWLAAAMMAGSQNRLPKFRTQGCRNHQVVSFFNFTRPGPGGVAQ